MIQQNTLPTGWIRVRVGEIFEVLGGGTPPTNCPEFWNGDTPWITSADIDKNHNITPRKRITEKAIAESATNRVPAGSAIIVTRVALGKVGLTKEPLCFSQDSQALVFNPQLLNPRYVVFQMSQAVSVFKHIGRGTTISGVTKKQLLNLEFSLAPIREQCRIVAEIEKQFTRFEVGIAALKRVQANLKRYRASVLKAACEGRLVTAEAELARAEGRDYESADVLLHRILKQRRKRWEAYELAKMQAKRNGLTNKCEVNYKEPPAPDTRTLPELPEGWVWASLSQCFTVERGRFSIRPRNDPRYYNGPYPFVQIGDLPRDGGIISGYAQTLNEAGLSVSKKFPKGTILIAIVGATIANTGILSFDSCCPDSLVALQSGDQVRSRFIELYLRSKKLEIRNTSYASGGQPNINLAFLIPYPVPLPPQAEQRRIVAEVERRLSVIDEIRTIVEANLKRAERLRQSILKQAFEGKLVPQDSSDEPAEKLLERIRAERAQSQARNKNLLEKTRRSARLCTPTLFDNVS